jgi:hypothetical protein
MDSQKVVKNFRIFLKKNKNINKKRIDILTEYQKNKNYIHLISKPTKPTNQHTHGIVH